jgi:hypothetical protein
MNTKSMETDRLEILSERIKVFVWRASEVSMTVIFSVTVDNLMIDYDGDITAPLACALPSRLSFPDDARRRLGRVARYTGSNLGEVETVVFKQLSRALHYYANWNFDEERDRQAAGLDEEAA